MKRTLRFAVIGLGFFGTNLALRLMEEGAEVIGIDKDQHQVENVRDKISYAVVADTTDKRTLLKLGVKDVDAVIVAIGENFESSLLTTAVLQEIEVKKILNRVTSPTHERILRLMNIKDLILPEAEAAVQIANKLMIEGVKGSFELSKEYGIFEIEAPPEFVDRTLVELDLRNKYGVNLVTIKRIVKKAGLLTLGEKEVNTIIGVPTPDTLIHKYDTLVLFGKEDKIKEILER